MNYRSSLCFFDFETTSKNPHTCQPTQLAACMIECRKLNVEPNGIFNSLIRPELDDEKAIAMGLDPVTDEVLKLTHLTREQLAEAPTPDIVWMNYCNWLKQFASGTGAWDQPIPCGYNIVNYDIPIINRLSEKYGGWDPVYRQTKIYHPINKIDIMLEVFKYTENMKINSNNSISMDSIRKWLGIEETGAHNAVKDVLDGGHLMIKFLRLSRYVAKELVTWENCFEKENEEIKKLMEKYG